MESFHRATVVLCSLLMPGLSGTRSQKNAHKKNGETTANNGRQNKKVSLALPLGSLGNSVGV